MAKRPRPIGFRGFDIIAPPNNGNGLADSANMVEVIVNDHDGAAYTASILANPDGTGAVMGGPQPLGPVPGTNQFSAPVDAGHFTATAPGVMNRFVSVTSSLAGTQGHPFRAYYAGSASYSPPAEMLAQRTMVGRAGQPIPVALRLQLDPPVAPGTCGDSDQLNRPILLVFSLDPSYARCWFSEAIDVGADGAPPAFWMLQRSAAGTWTLFLRRGSVALVTYRLTTRAENDVSFPITLRRAGRGGSERNNWPSTVLLTPAP